MSERLVISVDGSKDHPDGMTVQEAFTHVLELFQLVNESDPEAMGEIEWRLVSASMNSPFTVVAEAVSLAPNVDPAPFARRQKSAFRRNYGELQRGHIPMAWAAPRNRETVRHVLTRNTNGIGRTVIQDDEPSPLVVTPDDARNVIAAVVADSIAPRKAKQQIGSVEGRLTEISTLWGKPAIKLKERKNGFELWCTVPDAFQHEIAEHTSIEDVWKGARVVVRGRILYDADGRMNRVEATSVRRVQARNVSDEEIADKDFTEGLTVTEYLERLRDGTLG